MVHRSFTLTGSLPQINGQKYRGFGSTKQLAKQAAAEAALISYVKPPVAAGDSQEDKTPWATLVSFAMYKLFNDWREGRVGMCPPSSQPYGTAIPNGEDCKCGMVEKITREEEDQSKLWNFLFMKYLSVNNNPNFINSAFTDALPFLTRFIPYCIPTIFFPKPIILSLTDK